MEKLKKILMQFDIPDEIIKIEVISNGFINSTYKVIGDKNSYIFQKININVFPNVDNLMHNVKLVTEHIYRKTGKGMYVIPTKNGKTYLRCEDDFYRVYNFVENSKAYNSAENADMFKLAGIGFGKFQNDLADFDATLLLDVIANFHNTVNRLENFREAVKLNAVGRVKQAESEIAFLEEKSDLAHVICDLLDDGTLPFRVTHNDTKLNNILFDNQTNEPICAIDLDTVMKGSVLYDFGDAIRYGANPAGELGDGAPIPLIDMDLYAAFLDGFLSETHSILSDDELSLLADGVAVITYEQALRFLEDYLRGDVYYGEAFKDINLIRAKVQIALLKDILAKMPELKNITKQYCKKYNR